MNSLMEIAKNKRIIFLGTPDFAVSALSALFEAGYNIVAVVSQPDRPQGRKQILKATPVSAYAKKNDLKIMQADSINDKQTISKLKALEPDLIITAAYGQILRQKVLDIPKFGCLNIHASLLPLYRGAAPINAAIIDGQEESGITIMQMDSGCDTGDILFQAKVEITKTMNAGDLFAELANLGGKTIVEFLPDFFQGNYKAIKQNDDEATYAPKMSRKTGEIDWQKSVEEVERLIRGTQPWPGSYTFFEGKRIKIISATVVSKDSKEGKPGELINCDGGLIIQCGRGALKLEEIQFASGKKMKSEMCSHNYQPGIILGRNK